ncbi:MAG: autotransporter-associated beta strand repeat-containing protein, partial [Verrucomicrobiota bacterium]
AGNGLVSGLVQDGTGGYAFSLQKYGAGTWTLTHANAYSGGTTLNAGEIDLASSTALGTGAVTVNGGTLASVKSYQTLANNFTIGGSFQLGGQAQAIAINGSVNLNGQTNTITLANSATMGGVVSNGGLTLANTGGSHSFWLTASNTYAGLTTIGSGISLILTLGPVVTNVIHAGNSIVVNGALVMNGAETFDSVTGVGNITNTGALTIGSQNGTFTTGCFIQGSGSLAKSGTGTVTITNANTYSGNTTISAGTLALGAAGSINGSPAISIAAGATFDVSAISAYALSGASLSASGTGTNVGVNAATIKGGATVSLGSQPITLTCDGLHPALYISQGALSLNNNAFTVNSASPLAAGIYAIIQQAGGTITSSGTCTVSGTAIGSGFAGSISVSGRNVNLFVSAVSQSPPGFPPGGIRLLPDGISLTATGAVGTPYRLWGSTNLAFSPVTNVWTLLNNGIITGSPFTVTDLLATNFPQRFYRFSSP